METKLAEPELGQALFGNPTGQYDCSDFVEALVASLFEEIDRVYWNIHQKAWDRLESPDFPYITYKTYSWGECDCGWDEISFDEPHEDTCYQSLVDKELVEQHRFRRDKDGYIQEPKDTIRKKYCKQLKLPYPDGCAVHCTCHHEKHLQEWFIKYRKGVNGHAVNCEIEIPNFSYKGVELRWYKYFGRSMTLNVSKTERQWKDWYDDCMKTIRQQDIHI